jgi:hypothetical protein
MGVPRLSTAFPPPGVKDPTELAARVGCTERIGRLGVVHADRLTAQLSVLADWLYRLVDPDPLP